MPNKKVLLMKFVKDFHHVLKPHHFSLKTAGEEEVLPSSVETKNINST